jgi:hypothetical protein
LRIPLAPLSSRKDWSARPASPPSRDTAKQEESICAACGGIREGIRPYGRRTGAFSVRCGMETRALVEPTEYLQTVGITKPIVSLNGRSSLQPDAFSVSSRMAAVETWRKFAVNGKLPPGFTCEATGPKQDDRVEARDQALQDRVEALDGLLISCATPLAAATLCRARPVDTDLVVGI